MHAFPISNTETDHQGMTLRDYFAAKAMQAIIAKMPLTLTTADDDEDERDMVRMMQLAVACGAYNYAEAMMLRRELVPTYTEIEPTE